MTFASGPGPLPAQRAPEKKVKAAGVRRFYGAQARRPRPRQNRIGSAAARRDARALSRMRHSNAWLW
ncbi:hypothetical protein ACWGNM_34295 [Streptomyces sp. NPDC055796]